MYGQERLEGDLRAAHLRLRAWSVEIALASRGPAEADALERPLAAVLRNMRSLIDVAWLLSASTHALGYAGALLNYSCIGLAMLHGANLTSFHIQFKSLHRCAFGTCDAERLQAQVISRVAAAALRPSAYPMPPSRR